jgi:DNA polymerase I-like protein with 3'-5' exonuclease and polymerase domains
MSALEHVVDFDVETDGFQPHSGKRAFMFIFWEGNEDEAEVLYPEPHQPVPGGPIRLPDRARIQWWFDRAKLLGAIRAHNGKFDRSFAVKMGFDPPGDGFWHDSMVDAHIVRTNPKKSIALKALADDLFPGSSDLQKQLHDWLTKERARRAKVARDEGTELVEPTYADVPLEIIEPYGREDVYLARKVNDVHLPIIAGNEKLWGVREFERKVFDALFAVEMRGLPADRRAYALLEREVEANVEVLRDRCIDLAQEGDEERYRKALKNEHASLEDFNPQAPQQVLAALYARKADMSYMSVEDGKVSCDKENLEAVDDALAEAILEFRSEKKVYSTYVRPMLYRTYVPSQRLWKEAFVAPDGRIHTTYRQVGAITGRMSSADPNVQNQPRDDLRLRYNIRAEPGHKLVTCDLSNIEMRLFAAYAGPGRLLTMIRSDDADVHSFTARALGITDRKRAGGWIETARQRAKVFNFSVIYGGGFRTIRRQQRCNMAEAKRLKQRYYDTFPEVRELQDRIQSTLASRGFIQTLYGRKIPGTANEAYKYVNYLVQGTAAEILKEALISCHEEGIPVVALVHDEIIAHVPEDQAEATRDRIIYHLTQASRPGGRLWDNARNAPVVPLEAEGDIVDRWSQAKKPDFVPDWAKEAA